jgi:hypothetical protein
MIPYKIQYTDVSFLQEHQPKIDVIILKEELYLNIPLFLHHHVLFYPSIKIKLEN